MTGANNRLVALTKELRAEWEQTKQFWNDAKSAEFEKRYLDDLFAAVNQSVTNIDSLERILSRIRDECQ